MQETLHSHKSERLSYQVSYDSLESAYRGSDEKLDVPDGRETTSTKSLIKNWPLMSSIIVYCVFSLHDMAYTEVQVISLPSIPWSIVLSCYFSFPVKSGLFILSVWCSWNIFTYIVTRHDFSFSWSEILI